MATELATDASRYGNRSATYRVYPNSTARFWGPGRVWVPPPHLTYAQTKDKKLIHPPLKITNLKITIQDCNPYKDILTNKPIIQTHASKANVYDQNGNHIATLTTERLQWLWNQLSHNNLQHLTNFLHPPPQGFETEILWLIQRYILILA
jgi:hypothetical protein